MQGQIFLRETGIKRNGKEVFMVVGLATLDDIEAISLPSTNEVKYDFKSAQLSNPVNLKAEAKGQTLDSLLRKPIWSI